MYIEMQKNKLEVVKKDIISSLTTMQKDIERTLEELEDNTAYSLNIYGTIGMNVLYLIKCEAEYNKIKEMLLMMERTDTNV